MPHKQMWQRKNVPTFKIYLESTFFALFEADSLAILTSMSTSNLQMKPSSANKQPTLALAKKVLLLERAKLKCLPGA